MSEVPCSHVTVNAYATGALRSGDPDTGDVDNPTPLALATRDGFDTYYRQVFNTVLSESQLDDPESQRQELAFVTFPATTLPGNRVRLVVNGEWTGPATIQLGYDDTNGNRTLARLTLPDDGVDGFRDAAWDLSGVTAAMVAAGTVTLNGGPAVFAFDTAGLYQVYITYVALAVVGTPTPRPLRQHPRTDGLGVSSQRRVWPPSRGILRGSLRQGPGAIP